MGDEDELVGFFCTGTVVVLGDNDGSGMDAQAQVTAGPTQVQAPPGLSQSQVQVKGLKSMAEMAVKEAIVTEINAGEVRTCIRGGKELALLPPPCM